MSQKNDDLRPEYASEILKSGVRGKYSDQYKESAHIVRIAPDVAHVFGTEEQVNDALRSLIRSAEKAGSAS